MKLIYPFIILLLFNLTRASLANTYVFQPLEQISTNVYAFANKPEKWEKYGISKETLETILRQGTFTNKYMEWITLRKNLIDKRIDGVFFDVDGNGYKWSLIDTEMLHVESSSGSSGFVIFKNITIAPYLMSQDEKETTNVFNTLKVIGFIKDRPVTGPVIAVVQKRIDNFLQNGKASSVKGYKSPSEYTEQITDDSNGKVYVRSARHQSSITTNSNGNMSMRNSISWTSIYVSGSILTSDGYIYFWDLRDDNHLFIEDENRKGCVLSLE